MERGLIGTCLAVLFAAFLIGLSYLILSPFLPALLWAITIVISTWPLMLRLQRHLRGRRALASTLLVFTLFLLFVVPLLLAITTIVGNTERIASWFQSASLFELPAAPDWLITLPVVGPAIGEKWAMVAANEKGDIIAKATPYMGLALQWFVARVGNMGILLLHVLLTLILSAVLYARGERAAAGVKRFATRIAGAQGEHAILLASQAIRAVAYGVVGTALFQSLLVGLGFLVAGVPQAALLTAIAFFLGVVQIGPAILMLPVIIWLFWAGSSGWGTAMIVWTVVVGLLDNIVRPILIKKGADIPLLIIFAGVVGGLIAFGVIGLFVGPVVLAVSYTLLNAWIEGRPQAA